jgi:hypothetical protein
MKAIGMKSILAVLAMLVLASQSAAELTIDQAAYRDDCQVRVTRDVDRLSVAWPITNDESGEIVLELSGAKPLIERIGTRRGAGDAATILSAADPAVFLTVGSREIPAGKPPDQKWEVFFDNPHRRPHEVHRSSLKCERVRIAGRGSRATVTIEPLTIFPFFEGALEISFYAGCPLVRIDAIVSTKQDGIAMFYDAGLVADEATWSTMSWFDTNGDLRQTPFGVQGATPLKVRHRAIVASGDGGSLVCLPPPHQFQFPRDYSTNLAFVWHGSGYHGLAGKTGFGIRQNKDGGGNFVPWFNGQPGVKHRLGVFYLVSSQHPEAALKETLRYTHGDRFPKLPGYKTLTSHYHMAIAVKAMEEERRGIQRTDPPEYVTMFKDMNVNMVHLGEFHGDGHPRDPGPLRLPEMAAMFRECSRWSDKDLLLIPGEEINDYLGLKITGKHPGHWMSLFPRPVYWTQVRGADEPFASEHPKYGRVYHVGSRGDMIRLIKEENALVWAAHPRIKASSHTPDIFREEDFFIAPSWLGGAWKAMPGDLSREKQGERVLDLLDDMANWGHKKYVLGEVDVFKLDHTHELWAHMNVNYVRMDRVPRYREGWQEVLDVLSTGQFFVTTGEVLIPEFTVGGKQSGENLKLPNDGKTELVADVTWTFPLSFAEVISGDGRQVYRERIDLSDTGPFGQRTLKLSPQLAGRHWVRLEVWDIAANGAFTQPVWIE